MTMTPAVRKGALVVHVVCSVGWLGGVVGSLVLGVVVATDNDDQLVRAAMLTLELIGWYVLVPAGVASLVTGLVQALGTSWGLVRHYWVLIKLVMNVFAVGVLLLYMQTLALLADRARTAAGDPAALRDTSPAVHAAAAVVLLVVATILSVYKPRGVTPYGQRAQGRARTVPTAGDPTAYDRR